MGKRQHHKGKKRPKTWHRGRTEVARWRRVADLPDLGSGADPTSGAPTPLRRQHPGRAARGDAL